MAEKFKVEVVTPRGVVLSKDVDEVIAPGIMGEFGVLIGHTPMLTFVKPGILSYLENDKFTRFVVGQGFCEVLKDSVSVLVDEAFSLDQLDAPAAAAEANDLQEQLDKLDAASDPEAYQAVANKLKVARAKVSLCGMSS
jgi:F-type H+-transporting ATPase subunit epsilon